MCKQVELDAAVAKAVKKKGDDVMSDDERMKLVSTEQSLNMPEEPRMPSNISGLEAFTLAETQEEEALPDAESLFNLPKGDGEE